MLWTKYSHQLWILFTDEFDTRVADIMSMWYGVAAIS